MIFPPEGRADRDWNLETRFDTITRTVLLRRRHCTGSCSVSFPREKLLPSFARIDLRSKLRWYRSQYRERTVRDQHDDSCRTSTYDRYPQKQRVDSSRNSTELVMKGSPVGAYYKKPFFTIALVGTSHRTYSSPITFATHTRHSRAE